MVITLWRTLSSVEYIPRNIRAFFAFLCFVGVMHWLIFPYPSGLLHWHCGNLTIAPVPAKQPWWIWINTSCEFIMNNCITTTKQSTTKPCAYFLGYTVDGTVQEMWYTYANGSGELVVTQKCGRTTYRNNCIYRIDFVARIFCCLFLLSVSMAKFISLPFTSIWLLKCHRALMLCIYSTYLTESMYKWYIPDVFGCSGFLHEAIDLDTLWIHKS